MQTRFLKVVTVMVLLLAAGTAAAKAIAAFETFTLLELLFFKEVHLQSVN